MAEFRIAVTARCLRQPLKRLAPAAIAIGARGLLFDSRQELTPDTLSETGRRQFLHHLKEHELAIAGLSWAARYAFYEPERLDDRIASLKRVLEFAFHLKAGVVTVRIGRVPERDGENYKLLHEIVSDLAAHGNRVGSVLAITPMHDTAETLAGFVGSVTTGPVGIDFDPAGIVMSGQDPVASLRTLWQHVRHVQVRDAIRDLDGSGREVPVGRGEVDWLELLPLLSESGYRGWLTVDRTGGDDPTGDAARAMQYIRQVTRQE